MPGKLTPAQRDALSGLLNDDDPAEAADQGDAPGDPPAPDVPDLPTVPPVPPSPAAAPDSILAAGQADVARIVAAGQADAGRISAEGTADAVRASVAPQPGAESRSAPDVGQTADATPVPPPGGDIAPTVQHWYERRLWGEGR